MTMRTRAPASPAAKRALLAQLARAGAAPIPLSYGQRAHWVISQAGPQANAASNVPFAWTIHGEPDLDALERSFAWLVARHAIFRTTYRHLKGTPVQQVHPSGGLEFSVTDLGRRDLSAMLTAEAARPFDLASGPVTRVVVVRRSGAPPVLLWVTHHIAIDGWSLFQAMDELGHAYAAYARGAEPGLAPPRASYADFVSWQAAMLAGPAGKRLESAWLDLLGAPVSKLALPIDRPHPSGQTFAGGSHAFRLGAERSAALRRLVARGEGTLNTILLAAYEALLGRVAGQETFLLGTFATGRSRPEFGDVIGYLANPVVLRVDLTGDPSLGEIAARARAGMLHALDNQDYPFSLLVQRLGLERDSSRSPLFDASFTLRSSQRGEILRADQGPSASPLGAPSTGERGMRLALGDLDLVTHPVEEAHVRFDLGMELISVEGDVSGLLRYNADLFDPATVAWLADGYLRVLDAALTSQGIPLSGIELPTRPTPAIAVPHPVEQAAPAAAAAPAELVEAIAGIWSEVLDHPAGGIGPDDNFFRRGGHSLAAVKVTLRLQEELGLEVSIADLFEHATPARLAGWIAGPERAAGPVLVPRAAGESYPLSHAQESLWILQQLAPSSVAYSAPHAFRLRGPLDVAALEWALNQVIARHESLRTSFHATRQGPTQRVADPAPMRLPVVDTTDAMRLIIEEYGKPFTLSAGPPLRPVLYRVSPDEHVLLLLVHHIVFDGWSTAIFWRELCAFYRARHGSGRTPRPLPLQYVDYAVWERQDLAGERLRNLVGFWKDTLAGAVPTSLPTDFPRPRRPLFQGRQHAFDLPVSAGELCRRLDATPHMVFLAAFQVWLARQAGTSDVTVGSVVSGRSRAEVADLIGHFVNIVPIRSRLDPDRTFAETVDRVRAGVLRAYQHQELPLSRLVDELKIAPATPFDVLFTLVDLRLLESAEDRLPGIEAERVVPPLGTAQFDLALEVTEFGESARAVLEFDIALFRPETVAAMAADLRRTIVELVTDPDVPIARGEA
ncbi:condensation domain-containing protein [Nonomuraea recticatena]|uniref:Carrier domain-containing protein n=1 Tax=Nonomuraea recticatena TaxID=46178 RepID=A0ABN3T6X4_9ACTN